MRHCLDRIKQFFRNQSDTPNPLKNGYPTELQGHEREEQYGKSKVASVNNTNDNSAINRLKLLNQNFSDTCSADDKSKDLKGVGSTTSRTGSSRSKKSKELRQQEKQNITTSSNLVEKNYKNSDKDEGIDACEGVRSGINFRRIYGGSNKKSKCKKHCQNEACGPQESAQLTSTSAPKGQQDSKPQTTTIEETTGTTAVLFNKNPSNNPPAVDSEASFQQQGGSEEITSPKATDMPFISRTVSKRSSCTPHYDAIVAIAEPDRKSYISEYKTFVEDEKEHLIGTPFPSTEVFDFEAALNLTTINVDSLNAETLDSLQKMRTPSLKRASKNRTNKLEEPRFTPLPKTPEEMEYDATVAAEKGDIMTPLLTTSPKPLHHGRALHSEIAEVLRNLDANALRINNLSVEEKMELMRRFDNQHHPQHHHSPKSPDSGRSKTLLRLAYENSMASQATSNSTPQDDDFLESDAESGDSEVVLRRHVNVDSGLPIKCQLSLSSCLYERRQPTCPKLKLLLARATTDDYDEEFERLLMDVKFPTVLPPNPQLKALLIFHKTDNICEVVTEACHRHQLDVTVARTKEGALDTLSSTNGSTDSYHLIIIDARSTKHLDAEYIARSIRHTNGYHFTTIIAVVKKSFFEKDDVLIALLDAGVNRCVPETTNLSMCSIELKQILHSIVRPHNVMSTQQALYTALHRLKEVIIITDNLLRIQYANRAAERLLNMRLDEIISKPLSDIFVSDVSTINTQGKKNKEFDEILTVRRKSQEDVSLHVRVVPVACIGRTPTHFVFNFDVPGAHVDFVATLPQAKEAPRGSLHSIRRGSIDVRSVASDGLRRTSLAKLTSLPLEAPITKIINLLSQVQENCSPDEARLIDKVLEFLKREGLYSPQMKEIRTDDPIATDLIGALLTGPSLYSSRRSSNDSIIRVGRASSVLPAKMKATPLIMELLEESLNWEFDIFKLEEITEKRPLLYLGMEMFRRFDVFATLNIDENICKSWLAVIEANYHANNTYHNSSHAADVMQATGVFLTQLAAKDMGLDRIDEAMALIAAAAHDVDHPGRSSAFLCNSSSSLAVLYNDLSVLESHHAATTFRLTLSDDKVNIFKNLDTDTYKTVRSVIIDMILATEMTRHFEHLAKFVSVFGTDEEPREIVQSEEDSSILIRRMLIKVADVSNPARPFAYSVEWSRRIAEEYFSQTDEEKANSLPIMMPMFDRNTCIIPKSQIGFIEYIIQDMMHAWDSFIDMPQLITYMQINYSQWKKFEEQGILTLADIKNKQASLNSKKSAK